VHNALARAVHLYSAPVSRTFSRRDDCVTSARRVLFVTRGIRPCVRPALTRVYTSCVGISTTCSRSSKAEMWRCASSFEHHRHESIRISREMKFSDRRGIKPGFLPRRAISIFLNHGTLMTDDRGIYHRGTAIRFVRM